jgi:signal transduction histidine kinase
MINAQNKEMKQDRQIYQSMPRSLTGIVSRLRFVFAGIGLVVLAASVAGYFQARAISQAHSNLVKIEVPVLDGTHRTVRQMEEVFATVERAAAAVDQQALTAAQRDYDAALTALQSSISEQRAIAQSSEITQTMAALQSATAPLFALKQQLFTSTALSQNMQLDLVSLHRRAGASLETLNFAATSRIDALLGDTARADPDTIQHLFSDLFLTSLNLTNIALDLETIVDLTYNQHLQGSQPLPDGTRLLLENKIRRIVGLMIQIPPSPNRLTLARHVQSIDELLFAPDALLDQFSVQQTTAAELEAIRGNRQDIIARFSDLTAAINTQALMRVDNASARLDAATLRLMIVLAGALGLTVLTIGLTTTLIIEKQINRRMNSLHRAVEAIADGELAHPIDVEGGDELGDIARALGVFRQTALALERSNTDLEGFAYVAAHDLRAPLRAIHDLAEWTLDDDDNALSDLSRDYLRLLITRTQRLDNLLNDLLDYARAGKADETQSTVDIGDFVVQIGSFLDQSGQFNLRYVGPQIDVITYPTPLNQILMNLISNAIKHHDKDSGTITVRATFKNDRLHFSVSDDGPGIPEQYQDRVFALFQTLRSRDEVEGSGLGLAIIRKLIERYDCEITLTSNPSQQRGTMFSFDFPAERPTIRQAA